MSKEFPKIIKICDYIIRYSIYSSVFLLPIFFLPWTLDILDFNKQALLVLFMILAFFAWMVKVLVSGKISLNWDKTHIAVLFLLLIFLFSTIFSQDKKGSFWGWPRITSESFLTLIGLVLLYFIISNIFSPKEIFTSTTLLVCSNLIAILIGIFQILGLFLPFNFAQNTSFNTIGPAGALGIFSAVLLPILIVLEIYSQKWFKVICGIGLLLSLVLFILINYSLVWWMVLLSCALLILFLIIKKDFFDLRWMGLPAFFLFLASVFLLLKPQFPFSLRSVEVYLNQKTTFEIALKTLKELPVFGSGPGTFIFDFSKHRKVDYNQGLLWNIRFEKGASKTLTILATTGVLGFFSFLVFVAAILLAGVKFLLNKVFFKEDKGVLFLLLTSGLLVGFIALVVSHFLYSANLSLDFLFFFFAAAFVGLSQEKRKIFTLNPSSFLTLGLTITFTLFFILGLWLFILGSQRYAAQVVYSKGLSLSAFNQENQALQKIEKAAKWDSDTDVYLAQLSQEYLFKLIKVINDSKMPQEDKNTMVKLLINNSINAAKRATDVNPKNVSNWSIRGFVYQNLIGLVPASDDWALRSYDEALKLEPSNPYYYTQKGIVYLAKALIVDKDDITKKNQDLDNAKIHFDRALSLKSDYAPAHFQIAMWYQIKGETNEAIKRLEETKKYAPPDDIGLFFQLGLLYFQNKNWQLAQKEFERILAIAPNYSNALYFSGLINYELGENAKAIEKISKVSELNPDNETVKKVLENLKNNKKPLEGIVQEVPPRVPVEEKPK